MDILEIIKYVGVTLAGFLFGIVKRGNSAIRNLLETIDALTKQNKECHASLEKLKSEISDLKDEISAVRRENADLKDGQLRLKESIEQRQQKFYKA